MLGYNYAVLRLLRFNELLAMILSSSIPISIDPFAVKDPSVYDIMIQSVKSNTDFNLLSPRSTVATLPTPTPSPNATAITPTNASTPIVTTPASTTIPFAPAVQDALTKLNSPGPLYTQNACSALRRDFYKQFPVCMHAIRSQPCLRFSACIA